MEKFKRKYGLPDSDMEFPITSVYRSNVRRIQPSSSYV